MIEQQPIVTEDDLYHLRNQLDQYGCASAFDINLAKRLMLEDIINIYNTLHMDVDESQLKAKFNGDFSDFSFEMQNYFKQFTVKDRIEQLVQACSCESRLYTRSEKKPQYVMDLMTKAGWLEQKFVDELNPTIVTLYDLKFVFVMKDFHKPRTLLNLLACDFDFPNYFHADQKNEFWDSNGNHAFLLDGKLEIYGAAVSVLNVLFRRKYEAQKATLVYDKFLRTV